MEQSLYGADLLMIAESVAREKLIDINQVIEGLELAIQKAANSKYGSGNDIRATINRDNGDIDLARYIEVVEDDMLIEAPGSQIPLAQAHKRDPSVKIGDFIIDQLPPIDFGRIAAQNARQVIVQWVREAERERQYEEYKDRVGEIINGIIKRNEYGNLAVDLGRAEAIIKRTEMIPRERYQRGDRIRAYIYEVKREQRGPQIFLSRIRPEFMNCLFTQEVPEIYDGIIEIKNVARDPGSRAKIAVFSRDASIDPVGACVGMRGSRVQAVVSELQGEKIDIVPWSEEAPTFIVNALAPAEVIKIVLDEDINKIEVIVADEQLSLAIGRRGQNVRLASILTGWEIDILTEETETKRREQEFQLCSQQFMQALNVDEMIARLLVSEGFNDVEEITMADVDELMQIDNFDESIITELQRRGQEFLEKQKQQHRERLRELNIADDLVALLGLDMAMIVELGENGILTVEDFAGLSVDELLDADEGILHKFKPDGERLGELITQARIQMGWIEAEQEQPDEIEQPDEQTGSPINEHNAIHA
ncbi:MAG: transcription termination factor NusA [Pseudomonadota bacterium]